MSINSIKTFNSILFWQIPIPYLTFIWPSFPVFLAIHTQMTTCLPIHSKSVSWVLCQLLSTHWQTLKSNSRDTLTQAHILIIADMLKRHFSAKVTWREAQRSVWKDHSGYHTRSEVRLSLRSLFLKWKTIC